MLTDHVQGFLAQLFETSIAIESIARTEPGDVAATKSLTLGRSIENGLTKTLLTQNDLSASVPVDATTSQFATPQAFVDAVLAFMADGDNDIGVVDGVITNDRP